MLKHLIFFIIILVLNSCYTPRPGKQVKLKSWGSKDSIEVQAIYYTISDNFSSKKKSRWTEKNRSVRLNWDLIPARLESSLKLFSAGKPISSKNTIIPDSGKIRSCFRSMRRRNYSCKDFIHFDTDSTSNVNAAYIYFDLDGSFYTGEVKKMNKEDTVITWMTSSWVTAYLVVINKGEVICFRTYEKQYLESYFDSGDYFFPVKRFNDVFAKLFEDFPFFEKSPAILSVQNK